MIRNYIITALFSLAFVIQGKAQESIVLSLSQCREMALQHSEQLKTAQNDALTADLDRSIARKEYLPKIDGTVTGTYLLPDMDMMGMELQMRGMYMAGIGITQPIYAGGKIKSANRLAEINKKIQGENLRKTEMQIIAETDNAYWTLIAVRQKITMLEAYKMQMDTLKHQAVIRRDAGMGTDNELLRIETKHSEITYQLQKANNGAQLCQMALCNIIGVDLYAQIELDEKSIIITPPTKYNFIVENRPELQMLQNQVEVGKEQVKMARADYLPQLGISAQYMYYGNIKAKGVDGAGNPFSNEYKDGMGVIMASLKIPIFHWGASSKKVKKARLNLNNAELMLQRNTRLINMEAQQAYQNVTDGYNLILTAEQGMSQAEENLRVMKNRYNEGVSPLTELLEAQSLWQQCQSNLIEAKTQYKIFETEYLKAIGELSD